MVEFFWKFASFDPYFVNQSNENEKKIFLFMGIVLFLLAILSFISYTYVGYLLLNNIAGSIFIGLIFPFFLINFYRLTLITFSWYKFSDAKIQKPKYLTAIIKILFMSLNILFFIYAFEILLFKDKMNDLIVSKNYVDGIITRIKILYTHFPISQVFSVILWLLFIWPLVVRNFVEKYGCNYDELKLKVEEKQIRKQFNIFLNKYKNKIRVISKNNFEEDTIFDLMIDPPFDIHFSYKLIKIESDEKLFDSLDR